MLTDHQKLAVAQAFAAGAYPSIERIDDDGMIVPGPRGLDTRDYDALCAKARAMLARLEGEGGEKDA